MAMLKSGAAMVDITPSLGAHIEGYFQPRIAKDIHDSLFAKSLVLDDGETKLAIVVCDLLKASRIHLDKAKHLIEERCGIPPSNVLISCTHTHTGPPAEDIPLFAQRVADSVQLASNRLSEAELGCEREVESKPLANRRFLMKDGTIRTNPRPGDPNIVKPLGPVDPEINVLHAMDAKGKTISVLINYAMHYAGLSPTEKREDIYTISADWAGALSRMIQRVMGEEFVAILANGACGDVISFDPINPLKKVNRFFGHAERVAALIAAKSFWAINQMEYHRFLKLAAAIEEVSLPRRIPTSEEIELAKKYMNGERTPMNMRHMAWKYFFGPRIQDFLDGQKEMKSWVQVLVLGKLAAIVGLPGEIFVEHGLKIKKESPFKYTFVIELANDSLGYIPTLKAFEEDARIPLEASGSYETTIGPNILAPEAGDIMVNLALKMMNELYKSI
jgi:hypothetical protein